VRSRPIFGYGTLRRAAAILTLAGGCVSPASGQSPEPAAPAVATARRIIDVDSARRAKQAKQEGIEPVLLYPLRAVGNGLERGLIRVENEHLRERLEDWIARLSAHGIEPGLGGLGEGAGLGLGARLSRKHVLGSRSIEAGLTIRTSSKLYQHFGLDFEAPIAGPLFFRAETLYRNRPQEDFFGIGIAVPESGRADYKLQDRTVSASLGSRIGRGAEAGLRFGYTSARVFDGANGQVRSFGHVYGSADLPGSRGGEHLFYGAWLSADRRDSNWDPKRGALLRLSATSFDSVNHQDTGWLNYRFEVQAYRPLSTAGHVLAVRVLGDFNSRKGGSGIPFFKLARIGGHHSLRGYRVNRFADANAVAASLEYRYPIWPRFMDAMPFFDIGEVAPTPGELSWSGLRASWGVGFKVKTLQSALLRFDVALGPEGARLHLKFAPEF